jgi:hypothetical protein
LCATTGLLISPVTWTHHMIWVIPVVVWLGTSPARPRWGRPAAAFTTVLFWIAPIWWVAGEGQGPLHENGWQLVAGNSFLLWMVLLLVACAASMFRYRGTRLVRRMVARRDGRLGWPALQHPELVEPTSGSACDEAPAWPLDDTEAAVTRVGCAGNDVARNRVRPLVH